MRRRWNCPTTFNAMCASLMAGFILIWFEIERRAHPEFESERPKGGLKLTPSDATAASKPTTRDCLRELFGSNYQMRPRRPGAREKQLSVSQRRLFRNHPKKRRSHERRAISTREHKARREATFILCSSPLSSSALLEQYKRGKPHAVR